MAELLRLNDEGPVKELAKQLCCGVSSAKNRQGLLEKASWIRARQGEGLIFTKIGEPNSSDKVFVEYLPVEAAWVPIKAANYLHINCLWVSGSHAEKGSGKRLLQRVLDDGCTMHMRGVTAITTPKKNAYLTDLSFYKHFGFEIVDEAMGYLLIVKFLGEKDGKSVPNFAQSVHTPIFPNEPGLHIVYTSQCPFTYHYVGETLEEAARLGIPTSSHRITTVKEARKSPVPWTTYAAYFNGRYLGHEILTAKKLEKKLSELHTPK